MNFLDNSKNVADLERTQKWVEAMQETMRKDHEIIGNPARGTRPIPTLTEVEDSNNNATKVQLSEEPMYGFHFDNEEDEVQ